MNAFRMLLCAAALGGLVSTTAPAEALITPQMRLDIKPMGNYHHVCGFGRADFRNFSAQWVLAIHGSRSNGQAINQFATTNDLELPDEGLCMDVYKFGAEQGEYQASLTFAGAGLDVAGEEAQYAAWMSGLNEVFVPVGTPTLNPR